MVEHKADLPPLGHGGSEGDGGGKEWAELEDAPAPGSSRFQSWSISQLRRHLSELGVSTAGCIDRADLERLAQHYTPTPGSASSSRSSNIHDGNNGEQWCDVPGVGRVPVVYTGQGEVPCEVVEELARMIASGAVPQAAGTAASGRPAVFIHTMDIPSAASQPGAPVSSNPRQPSTPASNPRPAAAPAAASNIANSGNSRVTKVCAECNQGLLPGQKMKRCGGCKKVYYCSAACQGRHWQEGGHRRECKAWQEQAAGSG